MHAHIQTVTHTLKYKHTHMHNHTHMHTYRVNIACENCHVWAPSLITLPQMSVPSCAHDPVPLGMSDFVLCNSTCVCASSGDVLPNSTLQTHVTTTHNLTQTNLRINLRCNGDMTQLSLELVSPSSCSSSSSSSSSGQWTAPPLARVGNTCMCV